MEMEYLRRIEPSAFIGIGCLPVDALIRLSCRQRCPRTLERLRRNELDGDGNVLVDRVEKLGTES
jgi:hypothetical protein